MRTSAPFWTWLSHFTDWLLPLSSQPGDMPESDSTAIHYSNSFFLWEGNVYFYLRGLDLIWVLQGPDWLTPQSFWLWDSTSWFLYVDREVCSFFKKKVESSSVFRQISPCQVNKPRKPISDATKKIQTCTSYFRISVHYHTFIFPPGFL